MPPSAWEHHRENTQNALPFCAGLKKSPAEFPQNPQNPTPTPEANTERGWQRRTQNDGEASKSPVGETQAEREEAGVGGTSQTGQDSRWGHRHAPPLPRGQARGSVSLPSSPLGAQELGAPQPAAGMGRRAAPGEEGGTG